jgi:YVTN family beta-propeller protein
VTATIQLSSNPFCCPAHPFSVAITPDGSKAYVAIEYDGFSGPVAGAVSVIDTATNTVVGSPIPVGKDPYGIAIAPDRQQGFCHERSGQQRICDLHRDQHGGRRAPGRQ